MNYEFAAAHLELGEAVYREGWTDKEWVKLDPGSVDANRGIQPRYLYYIDSTHTKQNYVPSEEDRSAKDWFVFGEPKPEPPKPEPKVEKPVVPAPRVVRPAPKK